MSGCNCSDRAVYLSHGACLWAARAGLCRVVCRAARGFRCPGVRGRTLAWRLSRVGARVRRRSPGAPFGGVKETSSSSGRDGFRKTRARVRSRAAAGDPSPARRSLTCEASVGFGRMRTASRVRQCRTKVDRTAVSARWRCTCQKRIVQSNSSVRSEISRREDRTVPNHLPIRTNIQIRLLQP